MEKRFTTKADDNSISETPDRKTRLVLLIISGVLILGIVIAVAVATAVRKMPVISESQIETSATKNTEPSSGAVPAVSFAKTYADGVVPTDIMKLKWGMLPAEIKIQNPDVISEEPSSLSNEKNTVNLTYTRKANVGGFDFSHVVISADKSEGLYAFSYLLEKDAYDAVFEALSDEYGHPRFKSGGSAYWEMDNDVLIYLTLRTVEVDRLEHTFLQYINAKETKIPGDPDKTPIISLGMTVEDVEKRKIRVEKLETTAGGTDIYISERNYDITSDANLGKFAPSGVNASAVVLNFDPKADLTSYSFIVRGDHLYEVREKLASEYGNPSVNRDYSSQWDLSNGKAAIMVSYGKMNGSGRGFATEIRYSCSASEYRSLEMIKAVGRAARKGMKYSDVKNEIGKYNISENVSSKGTGTMTLLNNEGADIIVFGIRIRSLEIEFEKNTVTDVYYVFDGNSYEALKMNIETNYGPGESKLRYKDRTKRILWHPKATEKNKFSKLMLDYIKLKTSPKARVHYYG